MLTCIFVYCISGQSSIPNSVPTVNTSNGIEINWDPVQLKDCATNYTTVAYTVRVTSADGHEEGRVVFSSETSAVINDLKAMLDYDISVSARTVINIGSGNVLCDIGSYQASNFSILLSTSSHRKLN